MATPPAHVTRALEVLERTPATLRALVSGLPPHWTEVAEDGRWSVSEVLGHLVHGELEDWIPRARRLLEHGEALAFEPFDPEGFRPLVEADDVEARLVRFARLRAASVEALRGLGLTGRDLARAGTHPAFGRVTLGELLATWAVHDLGHVAQVARTMARAWGTEVGPWSEYLPVLSR